MADLEQLLTYLTLISVPIGVFYHIMTLNNTRRNQQLQLETRQASMYMGLINTLTSPSFRKYWHISETTTWKDHADYTKKYPPGSEELTAVTSMFVYFDSIGTLVKKQLIDMDLIDGSLALSIVIMWRLYEPIITGDRDYFQTQTMWEDYEYLYGEISKREEYTQTTPPEYQQK